MNVIEYYRSISKEINAVKDRIRHLMGGGTHWLTDGEHKEAVLRNVIRRHISDNYEIARGFILTPNDRSSQIDILIYNKSYPTLFKDGDLVYVTPDAVEGIIEVKSNIHSRNQLEKIFDKLSRNAKLIHENHRNKFVGLFSYNSNFSSHSQILEILKEKTKSEKTRVINHISLGDDNFIKFWDSDPTTNFHKPKWHSYKLEELAPGYFISNLVSHLSRKTVSTNYEIWFPKDSKEINLKSSIELT